MGRINKRTSFGDTLLNKNWTDNIYVSRLMEIWVSMIKYNNLPDTCDERYMELQFLTSGRMVFFLDDVVGYLCLNVLPESNFNVYGIPYKRRAYSRYNNYQAELDDSNSVIIWNNLLRTPSIGVLMKYGLQIAELDRIISVNSKAQKTPVLVQGTEKQRLSLMNLYTQWDGNTPVIFGDKDLGSQPLRAISTEAPYKGMELYALKTQLWGEALTYIGVPNIAMEKKERLLSSEVSSNLGGTIASRYSRLEARRQGFDKVNKMFGTKISIEYRDDFDITEPKQNSGGTNNNIQNKDGDENE